MGTSENSGHESLPYRPCVGVMLINHAGCVFVGKRMESDVGVAWQMPQGGIDPGEAPEVAAMRELEEEVGTSKARIIGESSSWLTYDLPAPLMGKALKGKYRGQKQKWFAMEFTGSDGDIDLNAHHKPEFSIFKWVEIDELPELIVEFKRSVYEQLVEEFRELAARVRDR